MGLHQDICRLMYDEATFTSANYKDKKSDVDFVKRGKVADCLYNRFVCTYLLRTEFPHLNVVSCIDRSTGKVIHGEAFLKKAERSPNGARNLSLTGVSFTSAQSAT